MKQPNKKLSKVLGTKVSPGQQIINATKPSARNAHTTQKAINADAAYKQQKDMAQMRKGTKGAINQVLKKADLDITGAQKVKIFDQLDPKNNQPQRYRNLDY